MAAFSYIPSSFFSFSSDRQVTQCWLRRSLPVPLVVCCATPGRRRRRTYRRKMSDEDLRNGLKEFVSSIGLPDGHVPTTNELTKHGRKDLANMVRRRGYDEIGALLGGSVDIAGQDKKVKDLNEEFLDSTQEVSSTRNYSKVRTESDVSLDGKSLITSSSLLQDKVESFLSYGQLDTVEEDCTYQRVLQGTTTGSDEYKVINGTIVSSSDLLAEVPGETSLDKDNDAESEMTNQIEVEHLRLLLQRKELELSRLKKEIEKEKQALSSLQSRAEHEINKAQELISEKDAELLAAEESLSGLKEVTIQYSGKGETVEVSGSFNGWHQPIKMEPQVSQTGSDTTGSRKPEVWSITLWLYPGEYEIKFVVDGLWKIDPAREITRRGGLENNILRVDK